MKFYLILIVIFINNIVYSQTQNLVFNYSFENGIPSCNYLYDSDYNIQGWTRGTQNDYDTFDWYDLSLKNSCGPGINVYSYKSFPINNNGRFISLFGDQNLGYNDYFESVKTVLSKKLKKETAYILRCKLAYGMRYNHNLQSGSPKIKFHVSEYNQNWQDNGPYNTKINDLAVFEIPKNQPNTWINFEKKFFIPENKDNKMENLIIESVDEDFPEEYFVYIDDVELIEIDPCNYDCLPVLGAIIHPDIQAVYNANMQIGVNGSQSLQFSIENATTFEFSVWDRYGAKRYSHFSHDVNGLSNDPNNSFKYNFVWNGTMDDGQKFTGGWTYPFILRAENCNQTILYNNYSLVILDEGMGSFRTLPYEKYFPECCVEERIIQNVLYNKNEVIVVNDNIIAGSNVTIQIPTGLVEIPIDKSVIYRAGNEIILKEGFQAFDGSQFLAEIIECESFLERKPQHIDNSFVEKYIISDNDSSIHDPETFFIIYPNPASNHINIISKTNQKYSYKIFDTSGQIILEEIGKSGNLQIEVSKVPSGLYLIQLNFDDRSFFEKIIII